MIHPVLERFEGNAAVFRVDCAGNTMPVPLPDGFTVEEVAPDLWRVQRTGGFRATIFRGENLASFNAVIRVLGADEPDSPRGSGITPTANALFTGHQSRFAAARLREFT